MADIKSQRYWVVSGDDVFVAGYNTLAEAQASAAERNARGNYGYKAVDITLVS